MSRLSWYMNRLRAMNAREVAWRLGQKVEQAREKRAFAANPREVCSEIFDRKLADRFGARVGSLITTASFPAQWFAPQPVEEEIELLGQFPYSRFRKDWHAGFQTSEHWPRTFSYDLQYKQRDDIGDARTNWELNRHFQFARLAENYAATADEASLDALDELFTDWCRENPFLIGISWTSPMEVAIRAIQWMLTSYYLAYRQGDKVASLRKRLEIGVINMVAYVALHRSRFSSANNHLLVEAASIAIAGHALQYSYWRNLGVEILDEQLDLQNAKDGVNLEMALHYQSFAMEAYALTALILGVEELPKRWGRKLQRQCNFVRKSMACGATLEFGDNDEGKIIYPHDSNSHYDHVLHWLESLYGAPEADSTPRCATHFEGGYTFLSDSAGRTAVAIDHAPLGFGSIAAHGHADALSFQAAVDGNPVFVDPGTCIYHCNLPDRDYFRRTKVHNTLCINDTDQSQMLGAFLWGKRAETTVDEFSAETAQADLTAHHNGYAPDIHYRHYHWDATKAELKITDKVPQDTKSWCATLMLAPDCQPRRAPHGYEIIRNGAIVAVVKCDTDASVDDEWYSPRYGVKVPTKALRFCGSGECNLTTTIIFHPNDL